MTVKKNVSYVKRNFVPIKIIKKSTNKVRDHCHFTVKYRGAAHSSCNLKYKVPRVIPVVFHNGSAYVIIS